MYSTQWGLFLHSFSWESRFFKKCVHSDWDVPLPDPLITRYMDWCEQLSSLSEIRIQRCVKPPDFIVSSVEFHHFADASVIGYGVCSYLRLIDSNGNVSVTLIFSLVACLSSQTYYSPTSRTYCCCTRDPLFCHARKRVQI